MSRILVTGGNGYLGKYIYKYLKSKGHDVIITSRKNYDNDKIRYLDLLDEESIIGICKGIDIVVHTATMNEKLIKENIKETYLVNSYGTRNLFLDAIRNNVSKFIYFSTFHVYGKSCGVIDENSEVNPLSDYGLSHYFAERYIRQNLNNTDCKAIILRLTNGIGVPINTDKWYLALNDFCKTIYETGQIIVESNGLAYRDFIDIEDVVDAVDNIIDDDRYNKFEVYNISSQKSYTIKEVAEIVKRIYEIRYKKNGNIKIKKASNEEIEKFKKTSLLVKSEKLRRNGWSNKISIEETINNIFDYLEEHSLKN